ncbi:2-dehydropantoate 2-reductase [Priestia taiwanensis]|uniref:2-dehydropantoate 2-reductase n=1 Tax=Priestia taiwanensis TaxID=1347902 RepID=A0A917APS3_9BACI|nr:2-dehydropantoate 2-reductase [Priestia taiwanensis]MBM7362944.1 2-dehydropantoate 2-reductase [Priestia taiwanensis]GGE66347.1 2-dehydropantoate 2-reductase [Priestia taiwanensis]
MRIGIIGAGAIGMLVGAYVKEKDIEVTFYTRREQQAKALRQKGLTCIKKKKIHHYSVDAVSLEEGLGQFVDILFVAVKQYHLSNIQEYLLKARCETIVFLQNGMGHVSFIESLPQTNIGVGIVEHGALKHDDTTVEHTGIGMMKLGTIKGDISSLAYYTHESFPVVYEDSWKEIMGKKLMVNAVINPLTALYNIENGGLLLNVDYHVVMKQLFNEVFDVIGSGEREEEWRHICMICEQTKRNRSSMLRDIDNGRQTEIDAILGYIVNEAGNKNISIPVTMCMYHSIKGLERQMNVHSDVKRKEVFQDANK